MKTDAPMLVQVETGYEKAVSKSKLVIERNASLLEVTMPIGVIRRIASVPSLKSSRAARGSTPWIPAERPPGLGRVELALIAVIGFVSLAAVFVALS